MREKAVLLSPTLTFFTSTSAQFISSNCSPPQYYKTQTNWPHEYLHITYMSYTTPTKLIYVINKSPLRSSNSLSVDPTLRRFLT
jgi:hypothetical protein